MSAVESMARAADNGRMSNLICSLLIVSANTAVWADNLKAVAGLFS